MNLLLDTPVLLRAAGQPSKLSPQSRALIDNTENTLYFSAASLWEVTIKRGLNRPDFRADPRLLRRGLLDNGYVEISVGSQHAVFVDSLPPLHKAPFDRILIAQACVEGITLLTADATLAAYPGPILTA